MLLLENFGVVNTLSWHTTVFNSLLTHQIISYFLIIICAFFYYYEKDVSEEG